MILVILKNGQFLIFSSNEKLEFLQFRDVNHLRLHGRIYTGLNTPYTLYIEEGNQTFPKTSKGLLLRSKEGRRFFTQANHLYDIIVSEVI